MRVNDRSNAGSGRNIAALKRLPALIAGHGSSTTLTGFGMAVLLLPILFLGTYYSLAYSMVNRAPGETGLSALTWLRTGVIGDPYIIPTGPTAHTAPGTVAILASAYAVFDGNTPGARILLSFIALLEYAASAGLVLVFCRVARLQAAATCVAVALGCFLPIDLYDAAVNWRQWDQPTSAPLLTALLLVWLRPEAVGHGWLRPASAIGVIGGIGGVFAPALPLVAVIAACALGVHRRDWRLAAFGTVIVVCAMAPWAIRNDLVLGKPILTRSNFPLELAVGNNDTATGVFDLATIPPIHPHDFIPAAARVAEVGELRYMQEMQDRALSWIREHPRRFAELCLQRARLLLFPDQLGNDPVFRAGKRPLIWIVNGSAVLALLVIAARRQPVLPWVVCIGLPLAPYVLTHVSNRYTFPIHFALICLIAASMDQLLRRSGASDQPGHTADNSTPGQTV